MFSYPRPFLETIFRDTVILNVGGTIHQVKWETIEKFPKSRLHNLRFAVTEGHSVENKMEKFLENVHI